MTKNGNTAKPIVELRNLQVGFDTVEGLVHAVENVSLSLHRGRITALVGESGCGKSVTAYSIMRLVDAPGRITGGQILFTPGDQPTVDIAALRHNDPRLYSIRGGQIGMIFQEPMTALSPVHTVGNQIMEALHLHRDISKKDAIDACVEMLGRVGIPNPATRVGQYPFEMSGGMRQRVVIAMAMICQPALLIADEPTTALDVTIQAQILELMKSIRDDFDSGVLLITHDLGVVAQVAEYMAVMYLGRIVEEGPVDQVITNPRHPYTAGLLASLPGMNPSKSSLPSIRGSVPSLFDRPNGCEFHPRCPFAESGRCDKGPSPELAERAPGRYAACHRVGEIQPADPKHWESNIQA